MWDFQHINIIIDTENITFISNRLYFDSFYGQNNWCNKKLKC